MPIIINRSSDAVAETADTTQADVSAHENDVSWFAAGTTTHSLGVDQLTDSNFQAAPVVLTSGNYDFLI